MQTPTSRSMARRDARTLPRAMQGHLEYAHLVGFPLLYELRRSEVAALLRVEWKGRSLVSLVCSCCGQVRNVPETIAWSIVTLKAFRCQGCTYRPIEVPTPLPE